MKDKKFNNMGLHLKIKSDFQGEWVHEKKYI